MAATAWRMYSSAKEYIGDSTIDLDGHVFKLQLHTSTYTPNLNTHTVRADLTNELATANGYTAGGATIGSITWVASSGTATFDSADVQWTATGGSITARHGVIYDDTPSSPLDPLLAYATLDATPADVTATDGNTFTVAMNASGIFTWSGGTA
jgi:hypothetical protein